MPDPINIECEIRAFLTDEQYDRLSEKLAGIAEADGEDEQVTYYFEGNGDPDLRIQRNSTGAKIWFKKGRMHDEARLEIELPCRREDFGTLEQLFSALGYAVSIKWFRKRRLYRLEGVTVTLDDTRGYGKILELEKVCFEGERDEALGLLKARMSELGIEPTPKEAFDLRYAEYKRNWRELTGER
jgi:predicted adenylyl cyclase CyaB